MNNSLDLLPEVNERSHGTFMKDSTTFAQTAVEDFINNNDRKKSSSFIESQAFIKTPAAVVNTRNRVSLQPKTMTLEFNERNNTLKLKKFHRLFKQD